MAISSTSTEPENALTKMFTNANCMDISKTIAQIMNNNYLWTKMREKKRHPSYAHKP